MKLLFDCTELSYYQEYSGHRAGVFNVALNLFKELKKEGVKITFICDYRRYYFMKKIKEFREIPLLEEHSFINKLWGKIIYLTRNFPLRIRYAILILSRFYDSYFYRINKKNLNQLKDFEIFFSPFSPPSKEVANANLKRFRMIHDVIPIMEHGLSKSPKDWYYKIYKDINAEDYYLTNSEQTKKDVLKYFPFIKNENIKTTLLGADDKFKPVKDNTAEKYVFSLCTLGKRKNIIFGIRNFFNFIDKHQIKDLKLILGGGTWKKFENELLKELDKVDISKIEMTGYIKDEDLPKYYSNAVMFIYPSLYEGFGLPVLEAMKCGCPVIASNKSSIPEVLEDCGILINPENDTEMINAFEKMYFDTEFRNRCIEKGLKRAEDFNWNKCALELLEFIKTKCI